MADKIDVREFVTGATRSPLGDKYQYEGFLSPVVLQRFARYMHKHRFQSDGRVREADNWQKGMPKDSYIDSGWRHFMDWWLHHRGHPGKTSEDMEESLCALMFNVMGYLNEVLKEKDSEGQASRETRAQEACSVFDRITTQFQRPTNSTGP